jgi:hypothetical protein
MMGVVSDNVTNKVPNFYITDTFIFKFLHVLALLAKHVGIEK